MDTHVSAVANHTKFITGDSILYIERDSLYARGAMSGYPSVTPLKYFVSHGKSTAKKLLYLTRSSGKMCTCPLEIASERTSGVIAKWHNIWLIETTSLLALPPSA